MPELGKQIRAIREEKGMTLEDAGEQLNIKCEDLRALEEEDFSFFPDRQFAWTILELYVTFLGMNKEDVRWEFSKMWPEHGPLKSLFKKPKQRRKEILATETAEIPELKTPAKKKFPTAAVAGILVLAVVVFGVWKFVPLGDIGSVPGNGSIVQTDGEGEQSKQTTSTEPERLQEDVSQEVPHPALEPDEVTTETVDAGTISVTVTTPNGECWVEVYADGEQIYYRLVPPDTVPLVFEAQEEMSVLIGDAAAARIKVNGEDLGALGAQYVVVQKLFTSKN